MLINGQIYVGMSRLLRRWTAVPLPGFLKDRSDF
nr:MAG TPA: hypothetical protein [Bacteriophage sp.]